MATPEKDSPSSGSGPANEAAPGSQPLHNMFTAVPQRYDLLNRLLTWGLDERWRRQAARECLRAHPRRVLDLCCGTGDLAFHLTKLAQDGVEVMGVDFCEPMLDVARRKATARGLGRRAFFVSGDVANLPFPEGYFDALGISFAFRNLTYRNPLRQRYLAEILRVLVPEGRCVIVETSQPRLPPVRWTYHLYLRTAVPRLSRFLSPHPGAYRYLAESALRFYGQEGVSRMLREAGFREVWSRPLLGGVAAIHVAIK